MLTTTYPESESLRSQLLDKRIKLFEALTFCSCEWTSIEEYGNFNESILENLTVISLKVVKTA